MIKCSHPLLTRGVKGFYPGIKGRVSQLRILDQRKVPAGSQKLILGLSAQAQADVSLGDRPFQVVDRSRKKNLPAGVTPISKGTTPRRAAKDKTVSHEVATQDERMSEASGSGSASEEDGAGSDGTVVEVTESDWVIISSVCSISLMISLLISFSTILSLLITDLIRLN